MVRINRELIAKMERQGASLAAGCARRYPVCPKPVTERERVAAAFGQGQLYYGAAQGTAYLVRCEPFNARSTEVTVNLSVETHQQVRTNTVQCGLVGDLQHGAMVFAGDLRNLDPATAGGAPPPRLLLALDDAGNAWCSTATRALPLTRMQEAPEASR